MAKLEDIEGVGRAYARKLKKAGVRSTASLLKKGATPKGRRDIVRKSGLSHAKILRWVNHVDLFRVKGVGSEYADLLEAAGVDTIPELAQRKAGRLYQTLAELNRTKKLVRKLPGQRQVAGWINQAKKLPRRVDY
jgi:predicted flap endonuclease-1-like 5' DNA nuclease